MYSQAKNVGVVSMYSQARNLKRKKIHLNHRLHSFWANFRADFWTDFGADFGVSFGASFDPYHHLNKSFEDCFADISVYIEDKNLDLPTTSKYIFCEKYAHKGLKRYDSFE